MTSVKGPIIKLPKDESRKAQLQRKLEEYKTRIKADRPLTRHPELHRIIQQAAWPQVAFCILILEALFEKGEVNTQNLSVDLSEKAKAAGGLWTTTTAAAFETACAIIKDYCETGGAHTHGGTGLH